MNKNICISCSHHLRRPGQRTCRACHNAYNREWNKKYRQQVQKLTRTVSRLTRKLSKA